MVGERVAGVQTGEDLLDSIWLYVRIDAVTDPDVAVLVVQDASDADQVLRAEQVALVFVDRLLPALYGAILFDMLSVCCDEFLFGVLFLVLLGQTRLPGRPVLSLLEQLYVGGDDALGDLVGQLGRCLHLRIDEEHQGNDGHNDDNGDDDILHGTFP